MDLYTELSEKIMINPPTMDEVKSSLNQSESISLEDSIYLYALILHHAVTVDHDNDPLPYKIKKLSSAGGVIINHFQLPTKLQQIIVRYITLITQNN